jgi:hypothetical protein
MSTPQQIELAKYNPKYHLSKPNINRIAKDTFSKIEMVFREFSIPGLLKNNVNIVHKRKGGHTKLNLHLSINNESIKSLKEYYKEQLIKNNSKLKNIQFDIDQLLLQYKNIFDNYGVTYDTSYKNSFEDVKNLYSEEIISESIANKKLDILTEFVTNEKEKLEQFFDIIYVIEKEAITINIGTYRRKLERVRTLQKFAESKINELIILRDAIKKDIQNEYDKFKQEKFTKNYEDHGPISIF